jgi:precorrin-3B C17-methyltransferase
MTGRLDIVGVGPGGPEHRTAAAAAAVRGAEIVIGYGPYVDQCADLLSAQEVVRGAMGEEAARADEALRRAAAGARVALVSSGDAGVHGMAARTLARAAELADDDRPAIEVIPGVTAALAAGALLGAPLADDFAALSLSDLQVAWEVVERRLTGVAAAGLALALYNPRSRARTWQLERVLEVLREHRDADTPVAVVTDAARTGERVERATLATLDPEAVTMRSLLVVAGESGRVAGDWLVAQRGARGARSPRAARGAEVPA